MKRMLTIVLVVAALAAPAQAKFEHHYSDRQVARCSFQRNRHMSTSEVKDTIRCFNRRWPAGLRRAFAICWRESRCKAYAANKSSTAYCAFQWLVDSFSGARADLVKHAPLRRYFARMHIASTRYNPRACIAVAIITAHKHGWSSHW